MYVFVKIFGNSEDKVNTKIRIQKCWLKFICYNLKFASLHKCFDRHFVY